MINAELIERYLEDAADCARWGSEARKKSKAFREAGDDDMADRWAKIAKQWGQQSRQLRQDAARLRAWEGDKPQVGKMNKKRGGKSTPPRLR